MDIYRGAFVCVCVCVCVSLSLSHACMRAYMDADARDHACRSLTYCIMVEVLYHGAYDMVSWLKYSIVKILYHGAVFPVELLPRRMRVLACIYRGGFIDNQRR